MTAPPPDRVEHVTGIGGVFLRGRDPDALRAWYADNLGIAVEEWGGFPFQAESGDTTVWSIFAGDTDYWPRGQQAMVNYRVRDLDAMLAQLRAAGGWVADRVDDSEFGKFSWAADPEGNRFELWQPPAE